MSTFGVKDGARTLQFNGKLLGKSTSYKRGSNRWIEFALYKTESGSYVLSRIGVSLIYHGAACSLVRRYGLQEVDYNLLAKSATPCELCNPTEEAEFKLNVLKKFLLNEYNGPYSMGGLNFFRFGFNL